MSVFDRLDAIAGATVDHTHSERFRLVPMAGGPNARRTADPMRSIVEGRGVLDFDFAPAYGVTLGPRSIGQERNDFRALRTGRDATLSVARSAFPAGQEARQGDRIEMLDRSGAMAFSVLSVQPDGHTRVVLTLVEA